MVHVGYSYSVPLIGFILRISNPSSIVLLISWIGVHAVELTCPLLILKPMFLHKVVRETILSKIKLLKNNRNNQVSRYQAQACIAILK